MHFFQLIAASLQHYSIHLLCNLLHLLSFLEPWSFFRRVRSDHRWKDDKTVLKTKDVRKDARKDKSRGPKEIDDCLLSCWFWTWFVFWLASQAFGARFALIKGSEVRGDGDILYI